MKLTPSSLHHVDSSSSRSRATKASSEATAGPGPTTNQTAVSKPSITRSSTPTASVRSSNPDHLPYLEPLIFLSNPALTNHLPDADRIRVCQRDRDNAPGIIAALKFRNAPGLKQDVPIIN